MKYLIGKIDYWLYGDFWHQGFLKWTSEKEKAKRIKRSLDAEQLSIIRDNLEEAHKNVVLNNNDLELIN
ncbi:hypothetical protein [Vallitalea guaymasensis]|uniref:hypothetical protein n=1 Tax=Vallitalea guaymasensis TaxID=1185412 RepID=UPI000DE269EB|nr:hypothetical protein [Vallitalea guaymasensis]